eukprot:6817258-Alexandrium_andersonii.AAC.1
MHRVPLPPASAGRIQATDLVVTVHTCLASEGPALLSSAPAPLGSKSNCLAVLSLQNLDTDALRAHARIWPVEGRAFYLAGATQQRDAAHFRAVQALVERGAWARGDADAAQPLEVLDLPEFAELRAGLVALEADGLVSRAANSSSTATAWQLTRQSLSQLAVCCRLGDPELLFRPRGLPALEQTPFELVAALEDDGWTWALLPPPRKRVEYLPGQTPK